jgi:hypothetical protein
MGMADRHSEGVRSILLGNLRKIQQDFEHLLHLILGCPAVPDNRLLYLERGIFEDRQPGIDAGYDGRSARLPEFQRTLDIGGEEDVFHGNGIWSVVLDDLSQPTVNFLQSQGEVFVAVGMDGAVINMDQSVPVLVDNAITGDPRTGINAENLHGASGYIICSISSADMSKLA